MKNFKPGQKVVFSERECKLGNKDGSEPEEGQIVTIKCKCDTYNDGWNIIEFPTSSNGKPQSFIEHVLFPIEEQDTFAEKALKDAYIEHLEEENKELKRELQKEPA